MISRHGEEAGKKKWKSYCDRQKHTNTLKYFIEREGSVEAGTEFFRQYNYEKGGSMRPEDIAEKYGITLEEACIKLSQRFNYNKFYSQPEVDFVTQLEIRLGESIKYTHKTRQYCIWSPKLKSPVFYDICCTRRMKIIEFNGVYWHADPAKYPPDFRVFSRVSAQEIWDRDAAKIEARNRGFDVLVFWDKELQEADWLERVIQWFNS